MAHVAFAPDGVTLAAADNDGSVYLYDTASGRQTGTVAVAKPVDVVAFNPIGTLLATGDSSGSVRLWDARTLAPVGETMEDGSTVYGLAFAPNGHTLITGGVDGEMFIWGATGRSPIATTTSTGIGIYQLAVDAAGREAITADSDGSAAAWSLSARRRIGFRAFPSPLSIATNPDSQAGVSAVALDPADTTAALALTDGTILIDNARLTRTVARLPESGRITVLAFSSDGRLLAAGRADGATTLWDVRRRIRVGTMRVGNHATAFTQGVTSLAFDPDPCRARRVHPEGRHAALRYPARDSSRLVAQHQRNDPEPGLHARRRDSDRGRWRGRRRVVRRRDARPDRHAAR